MKYSIFPPALSFILFLYIIILSLSCQSVGKAVYGIKDFEKADTKEIIHFAKKYKIPGEDSYELDSNFLKYMFQLQWKGDSSAQKNHDQPLQVLYYNDEGRLQSYHINCYVMAFPNLAWNKNGQFSIFPPGQQAFPDNTLSLAEQINCLRPLPGATPLRVSENDYVVFVYWSIAMGRQSKRLVRTVQKNALLADPQKIKVIYVNNDNYVSRNIAFNLVQNNQ